MLRSSSIGFGFVGIAAVLALGCNGTVCEEFPDACGPPGGGGGAGGSASTMMTTTLSSSGGGGDGGGGSIDPGCIPSMLGPEQGVPADCGVFVRADATGDGKEETPTGNLVQAMLDVPNAKAVYICGTDTFTGSFVLSGGRSVFGGLDCDGWTYAAANRPRLIGEPDVPTLLVSGSGATKLEDFDVESPGAMGAGASSIALLVEATSADIARVNATAGPGATGAVGTPQTKAPTPAMANGEPGANGCLGMGSSTGGNPGQQMCISTLVDGGLGGQGTNTSNGGPGGDGSPSGGQGQGGDGEVGGGSPVACVNGGQGAQGQPGTPGPGAQATDLGTLTAAAFTGAVGGAGLSPGTPGQGGGGGGGANQCTTGPMGAGPGGGGGGAGGCGGNPGNGGGGGGGSFALVVINATVSLTSVSLSSGAGGTGGAGDAGQEGMDGGGEGAAGMGTGACNGGPGGKGGIGGAGGGGRGGPSVALAYVGSAPVENDGVMLTIAAAAAVGGAGGNGGPSNIGTPGADGILELRQAWP